MNHFTLTGNLVADPEDTRTVAEDSRVRNFRLAHSREGRDPLFLDAECWDGLTSFLDGAAKGDPVLVSGELLANEWTDKDGKRQLRVYIRAREVRLLRKKEVPASTQ